jgi:predicted PurR-regulated permease PerM
MQQLPAYARKALVISAIVLSMAAGMWLLVYLRSFVLLGFAAILFAVFLTSVSSQLSRYSRLPYGLALAFTIILFFGIFWVAGHFTLPTLEVQFTELRHSLPQSLDKLEADMMTTKAGRKLIEEIKHQQAAMAGGNSNLMNRAGHLFGTTLGIFSKTLLVLITGIFLSVNPQRYVRGFARLFSPGFRPRLLQVLDLSYRTLSLWLLAKFLMITFTGLLIWLGLNLLGIPMASVLALMAGTFSFVPRLGFLLASLPAVLIGLLQSPDQALLVIALYIFVESLLAYLIMPVLYQKTVSLPPALLLFMLLLMGIIAGGLGVFLAAPLLAVLLVLIKELYVKDVLERPGSGISITGSVNEKTG